MAVKVKVKVKYREWEYSTSYGVQATVWSMKYSVLLVQ